MPTQAIKKWAKPFAKKNNIAEKTAVNRLEKLWDKAKEISDKETGNEENWPYVMSVFKRMTGLFKKKKSNSSVSYVPCVTVSADNDLDNTLDRLFAEQNKEFVSKPLD